MYDGITRIVGDVVSWLFLSSAPSCSTITLQHQQNVLITINKLVQKSEVRQSVLNGTWRRSKTFILKVYNYFITRTIFSVYR